MGGTAGTACGLSDCPPLLVPDVCPLAVNSLLAFALPGEGDEGDDDDVPEGEEDEGEAQAIELGGPVPYPWEGTDRDYTYEEVRTRH